jgi:HEAT repeat protein
MSAILRLLVSLGLLVCLVFGGGFLAAEEPASDLQPILPMARAAFNNPWQFRNYSSNPNGAMVLSTDGKTLLSTSNGLGLWDMENRQQMQPRTFDTGQVNMYNAAGTLSPDGKTAAVVPMYYGGDMAIRFYDTASGKLVRELDNDEQISGLAFAPDTKMLAVSTRQRIELWDAQTGEELRVLPGGQNVMYRLMTFSPDGKMIAAIGAQPDTVHIWELASGKERSSVRLGAPPTPEPAGVAAGKGKGMMAIRRVAMMPGNNTNSNIMSLAFSRDSRLLAASTQDAALHVWDLQSKQEIPPLTGFRGNVIALVFSADGKELLAIDSEGTRLSWRVAALRRNHNVRLAPLSDEDFAELWNDLAEPDLFRAYRARRHLVADPKRAVPLLDGHLKPVPAGDTKKIQALVKDLSNPNAGTRRKAMTELRTKHGEAALGALSGAGPANQNGGMGMGGAGGPGMVVMGGGGNNNATMFLIQKLQAQYNTPERQRDLQAVHVLEEIGTPEARQVLARISKGAAGVNLTVEAKASLDHLAAERKVPIPGTTPEELWKELGSDDAGKAFRAICLLSAMPDKAVTLLQKEVKPVPVIADKEIATLIERLSDDDFKAREQASSDLAKIGEQALPALKKALDGNPPLEARRRIQSLVEQAASKASTPLLRSLRAVEVLEHSGTPQARDVLVALAGGAPQCQLTREARASLERLTRK